jgi:hypothetical protein
MTLLESPSKKRDRFNEDLTADLKKQKNQGKKIVPIDVKIKSSVI